MKNLKISNILIGLVFSIAFISIGVILSLNFRLLYYWDVEYLNISDTSGYSKDVILENYNALIDYLSPFYKGELIFPSMISSKEGLIHFQEVKVIFNSFYLLAALSLLALACIIFYKYRKKDYKYLKTAAYTVLILPLLVAVCVALNFEVTFILFHKIFFRNNYWIFNPVTDPVINILPETFFLHCCILIVIIVILGSMLLFSISHILDNKKRKSLLLK